MTSTRTKLSALAFVMTLALSVVVPTVFVAGTAAGNTLDSGSVSTSSSGEVDLNYAVLSKAGNSGVTVAYDASSNVSSVSDLQISLSKLGGSSLDSASGATGELTSKSGTVTLEVPDADANSDFTAIVSMVDTSGPSVIASDSAEMYVRDVSNPPAVDITAAGLRPYASTDVVVGYDSDGAAGSNLELRLYNDTSGTKLDTTAVSDGSRGGDPLALSARANDFTARAELWNTDTNTKLASDTASVTVGNPSASTPSKQIDPTTSTTVDVTYDAGPVIASKYSIQVLEFSGGSTTTLGSAMVSSSSGTKTIDVSSNIPSDMSERKNVMAIVVTQSGTFLASDGACLGVSEDPCPKVTSTSIEYADGTSASNVAVDASVGRFGLLDVGVHESGTPAKTNLSRVSGFDTSKDVWVNVTTSGTDIGALMGSAEVKEWFKTSVSSSKNTTHIRLRSSRIFRNETITTRDPSRWPTSNGAATTKRTVVDLSLFDFASAPDGANVEALRNATLSTDAQAFRPPQVLQQNGNTVVRLPVAGPHFETDGTTQNTGFYNAFIPEGMLTKMGVSNPAGLVANYQGSAISRTITEVNGGAKIRADIHYSAGNVDLSPDTTAPTADASSTGTSATEGSSHTFDASASTDNTQIDTYEWDVDGDGTYETSTSSATTSHTYASSGDRTATLRVTDANGNTATDSVTISVEATSDGGNSGGGTADSTTRWTASGTRISVTTSGSSTDVTVENPVSNEPIPIDVSGTDAENGVSLDTLSLSVTTDRTFTLGTSTGSTAPSGSPALDTASTGSDQALGYIEVEHSVSDSQVDEVRFDFRVSERRLADSSIDPGDVTLYRYHDGSWTALETTYTGLVNGEHGFTTTSPGLSTFAIGTAPPAPNIAVTEARLATGSATVGDAVDVEATVENSGDADGSATLELIVDGTAVTETSVTLGAGETRRVTLEHSFSAAGEYTVRVGDADAGSITVESVATPTPEPTATPTATATAESTTNPPDGSQGTDGETTTSGSGPGFGPLAALLALVVAVALGRRRG